MAYAIPDIITWAKISMPLARYNEAKERGAYGQSHEKDLDERIYDAVKVLEYEYAQNPNSPYLHILGNYTLALIGNYIYYAMQVSTGGVISILGVGSSLTIPNAYDFYVNATSFISTGQTTKIIPDYIGWNILFVRNGVTQSKIDNGMGATWYTWDKNTGTFTLQNGAAQEGENFQIYPVI